MKIYSDKGVILVTVLWILVILAFLTMGLSRRTQIDLALTKFHLGRTKAKYLALAGVIYSMEQVRKDSAHSEAKDFDTVYQCGIVLNSEQRIKDLFDEVPLDEGHFSIRFSDFKVGKEQGFVYGFEDEERKINLTALNGQNYRILEEFLLLMGVEEELATTIASAVVDWQDADHSAFNPPFGAEKEYYNERDTPYPCKNRPFDSLEELLLVKGMEPDIFIQIAPFLTIFPRESNGRIRINIDTATEVVLKSLALSLTGGATNTDPSDAETLIDKMLTYRSGEDQELGTPDDQIIELSELILNAKERVLFLAMANHRTKVSNYFRIRVQGVSTMTNGQARIETVLQRKELTPLHWRIR